MVAFEMVTARNTHEPDPEATKALTAMALTYGLVLLSCGYYGNTIRILAPLTIADETLDEGLDIIEKSLIAINAS
jgi:4-aminobutyrate aminotransferase/(S)-3-amino-2-methylpropionate transaminase